MLNSKRVKISYVDAFNDPLEVRPVILQQTMTLATIQRRWPDLAPATEAGLPAFMHDFVANIRDQISKSFLMACLSRPADELLLWSHYAANHTDVAISLRSTGWGTFVHNFFPVVYSRYRPPFDLEDMYGPKQELIAAYVEALTTKSLHWAYECEYRIFFERASQRAADVTVPLKPECHSCPDNELLTMF